MDDMSIIRLYRQRDEAAITQTGLKYGGYCRAVADNILHSREDTEECVNDTWLRSWNSIPPENPGILRAFLARITRNLAFDRYRAGAAGKRGGGELPLVLDELEECVSSSSDTEAEYLAGELGAAVNSFLRGLPERSRGVFLRRYFFVEPVSVIAERFGMSAGSVMTLLSRTRSGLKEFLKQEGYVI